MLKVVVGPSGEIEQDFDEFFKATYRRLLGSMWLFTGSREEAEDVAQEAYATMWNAWESAIEDPGAYLFVTAYNLARRRGRRRQSLVAAQVRSAATTEQGSLEPLEQVELRDEVLRLLASLTLRERAAMVLVDGLTLTSDQAGRIMGISPSTVRVLLARARKRIRKQEVG